MGNQNTKKVFKKVGIFSILGRIQIRFFHETIYHFTKWLNILYSNILLYSIHVSALLNRLTFEFEMVLFLCKGALRQHDQINNTNRNIWPNVLILEIIQYFDFLFFFLLFCRWIELIALRSWDGAWVYQERRSHSTWTHSHQV